MDFIKLILALNPKSLFGFVAMSTAIFAIFCLISTFWLIRTNKIKNPTTPRQKCAIAYFVSAWIVCILFMVLSVALSLQSMRFKAVKTLLLDNYLLIPFDTLKDGQIFSLEGYNACKGTNSFGEEWQDFNDNKFGGSSSCFWHVDFDSISNMCVLSMKICVGKCQTDPYAGIYSFFSPSPVRPFDCSRWKGITFDYRACPQTHNDPLRFWIQLATLDISDFAYYESRFPYVCYETDWKNIQILFTSFSQPYWANTDKKAFNLKKVFKVAVYARGPLGNKATLQLRNIRLFL